MIRHPILHDCMGPFGRLLAEGLVRQALTRCSAGKAEVSRGHIINELATRAKSFLATRLQASSLFIL